jgi:tripartite-type tricarboxylate transporter receptor subunit TctC
MFQTRRSALQSALAVATIALSALVPSQAQAQYPNKSIRLIVPYAPGGLPDTVARIVGQRLQERIGQPVVVDNRPGANGAVAAGVLATAKPDGYTFMVTDGSMLSINPLLYTKLGYDPKKDFIPVAYLARAPLFLAVHPKVPVGTLKEFVEYTKKNPLNYGSSGVGSTHHLSMEAIKSTLGIDVSHIPFKGTGQSVPALIGGQVEVLFSAYPSLASFVKDNRVKLLATNGAQRSPQAPDVPAVAELIPGFDFAPIVGMLAPAGTPAAAIEKIAAEANTAVKDPEAIKQLAAAGIEAVGAGPSDYASAIQGENDRVAKVIHTAGIKPE